MIKLIALHETELSLAIAHKLNMALDIALVQRFSDGELNVTVDNHEQYKNATAVIIQSTGHPVNETTLGVAFLAHELKNAGAHKVIAVTPYFGYGRQEQSSSIQGKRGHAAVIAHLFERSGIDELIAVELHDPQIRNFFSIPVTNLTVEHIIAQKITAQLALQPTLIAPDQGVAAYVQGIANQLGLHTMIATKERVSSDQTRVIALDESAHTETGIMIDDIIATGSTAFNLCQKLPERGYKTVYGYFVHPVLSGDAVAGIERSDFKTVYVSNSLPLPADAQGKPYIKQFDISSVMVTTLKKIMRQEDERNKPTEYNRIDRTWQLGPPL